MFVHTAVVLFMDLSMEEYINARRKEVQYGTIQNTVSAVHNFMAKLRSAQYEEMRTKCMLKISYTII